MEVFKCLHLLTRDLKTDQYETDLIFVDQKPYLVFEWTPDGDPTLMVEIDPRYLHKTNDMYMYEAPVEFPGKKLH